MIAHGFDPSRGRWIPWCFVGGMLLVVAVNAVLVWFALSSFTGVATPRAYDRGRTYNDVLTEAARQDALGWRAATTFEGNELRVRVTDAPGAPVQGELGGVLLRPLSGESLALGFRRIGPGLWAATVRPPHPGLWQARLRLQGPGGAFDIRERVIAP